MLFTYPESSSSELIQAEGANPLFDSLPFLSSCGGQKKKQKQQQQKNSHVLLSSALYLEQCPGYTHFLGVVRKSVISPGHLSGAASFLLPDAKLLQKNKLWVLKNVLTATVEHLLP